MALLHVATETRPLLSRLRFASFLAADSSGAISPKTVRAFTRSQPLIATMFRVGSQLLHRDAAAATKPVVVSSARALQTTSKVTEAQTQPQEELQVSQRGNVADLLNGNAAARDSNGRSP